MNNPHTSRVLSSLFILIFILASLIPIIYIRGKPERASSRGKKEQSVELNLYVDEECNVKLESIYWGEIIPGRNSTAVIYIKNRCNTPLTLNCTLANFSPVDAADYLNLDWDREAYVLEAHKTVEARLLLSVSGSAVFDVFNVDILISGTA